MPQQNTVKIDDNFGLMLISAVRYALGRQTYIVSTTTQYIIPLVPRLDIRSIVCMARDICEAPNYGSETIDKPEWMHLLAVLQDEIQKRNLKP